MPTAPLRPCSHGGCATLVTRGPCPLHARTRERRRGSAHQRGYTKEWQRARDAFLLEFPLCGMRPDGQRPVMSQCFDEGRTTSAYQVDHVVPHRGDQARFWDTRNWQALCATCGARKSQAGL